jgi:hypothetical protein
MKYEIFDHVIPVPVIPEIGELWSFENDENVYMRVNEKTLPSYDKDKAWNYPGIYSVDLKTGKVWYMEITDNSKIEILKYRLSIQRTKK